MILKIKRLTTQIFSTLLANLGNIGIKTGFCYPFFYCHACPAAIAGCPLGTIERGVYRGNFRWRLILYPLMIIGFIGIIYGRAVCGWMCPIGLLQRATGGVARKLRHQYAFIKKIGQHKIEKHLRYTKYLLLTGLVVGTTAILGFMFTDICPIGFLTGSVPILILNPGKFTENIFFYPAMIISILFIILILTVERGWCRYLCPVGAMLAPFNRISVFHIFVDKSRCIGCQICSDVCPMGIDVPNMERDPECILCGKCIEACPYNVIEFKRN